MDNYMKELYLQASQCTKCSLHKSRNKVVFGDGAYDSDIMFIGEAPGADEDTSGLPFVGLTGKLLRATMEAVGINIPDVFITNTLMCRPPNNRDPSAGELKTCRPWLDSKVAAINPKIIVSVGRFATAHILGESPGKIRITKMSGKTINNGSIVVIPLVHPSYINRGGVDRRYGYVEHMAKIATVAQEMALKGV